MLPFSVPTLLPGTLCARRRLVIQVNLHKSMVNVQHTHMWVRQKLAELSCGLLQPLFPILTSTAACASFFLPAFKTAWMAVLNLCPLAAKHFHKFQPKLFPQHKHKRCSREINHFFLDPEISRDSCTSFHTQNYTSGFGEWSLLKFCVCLLFLKLSWSERTSYLMDNPPGSSGIKKWNIEKECSSHSMKQHQESVNSKGRFSAQHSVPPGPALLEQRPFRQARYRALPCLSGAGRNTPKAEFLDPLTLVHPLGLFQSSELAAKPTLSRGQLPAKHLASAAAQTAAMKVTLFGVRTLTRVIVTASTAM